MSRRRRENLIEIVLLLALIAIVWEIVKTATTHAPPEGRAGIAVRSDPSERPQSGSHAASGAGLPTRAQIHGSQPEAPQLPGTRKPIIEPQQRDARRAASVNAPVVPSAPVVPDAHANLNPARDTTPPALDVSFPERTVHTLECLVALDRGVNLVVVESADASGNVSYRSKIIDVNERPSAATSSSRGSPSNP